MNYRDASVLITGGRGFLGRHLRQALEARQARVLAPSRTEMDVTRIDTCQEVIGHFRPDVVFHLAGHIGGRDEPDALQTFHSNVAGSVYVLEACRTHQVRTTILMGTADELDGGVNLYGVSRACSTLWARGFARYTGLNVGVARVYLAYGPGQKRSMFLPALIDAFREGRKLDVSPGHQTRDFVWIEDVVEALLRLATSQDLAGAEVEICTGTETSLRTVVALMEELTGRRDLVNFGARPYRVGEPFRLVGDPTNLEKWTGFRPTTTLHEGLSRLV